MLTKRLTKIGNSRAVIIDKPVLDVLGIEDDTEIQIAMENGALVLRPASVTEHRAKFRAAQKRIIEKHGETFRKLAK
jgi:antitoxin component of MazEF toxin-antitoxin module